MANDRVTSVSGFVFAIATFVGLLLLLGGTATGDTTNAEAAAWLGDSGHRARMLTGAYVMCGGAVAFIVFAAGLFDRFSNAGAPRLAVNVARIAAVAFAVLTMAAAMAMASAAYAVMSDVEPEPIDAGAVRVSTFGFTLWAIPAAIAGATFIASMSVGAFASGALPRWLALIGLLLAAVVLFGIYFLPTLGILAWAVLVAIVTLVRGEVAPLAQPYPSPGEP